MSLADGGPTRSAGRRTGSARRGIHSGLDLPVCARANRQRGRGACAWWLTERNVCEGGGEAEEGKARWGRRGGEGAVGKARWGRRGVGWK
jgi:hypothetical protein